MNYHMPVLLNVFVDLNEESVVLHISFDSIRIRLELKFDSNRIVTPDSIRDSIRTQTAYSQVPSLM